MATMEPNWTFCCSFAGIGLSLMFCSQREISLALIVLAITTAACLAGLANDENLIIWSELGNAFVTSLGVHAHKLCPTLDELTILESIVCVGRGLWQVVGEWFSCYINV